MVLESASDVLLEKNDNGKDKLIFVAKRAKYSFLACLTRKSFPKNSPVVKEDYYGLGAIVPLVTKKDEQTVLLNSTKYDGGNYGAIAGFVEAEQSLSLDFLKNSAAEQKEELTQDSKRIRLIYPDGSNIIGRTACKEAVEEVLGTDELAPRVELPDLANFSIASLIFRRPAERGFCEAIVPVKLNCTAEELVNIIKTNEAPDSREHNKENSQVVMLYPEGPGIATDPNDSPEQAREQWAKWAADHPGGRDIFIYAVEQAWKANYDIAATVVASDNLESRYRCSVEAGSIYSGVLFSRSPTPPATPKVDATYTYNPN